jgi:hypothetical protein
MPQLTFPITPDGLAVPVWIGLSGTAAKALQAAQQSIPAPLQARGVLDTASTVSAVASWVLRQLAIPSAATGVTQTAAALVPVKLYEISLSITKLGQPGAAMLTVPDLIGSELATALPDVDVLVGLDVLLQCKLLLDGPGREFTLEF